MPKRHFPKDIAWPICEVQPQQRCELVSGAPRIESQIESKWIAAVTSNMDGCLQKLYPSQKFPKTVTGEVINSRKPLFPTGFVVDPERGSSGVRHAQRGPRSNPWGNLVGAWVKGEPPVTCLGYSWTVDLSAQTWQSLSGILASTRRRSIREAHTIKVQRGNRWVTWQGDSKCAQSVCSS